MGAETNGSNHSKLNLIQVLRGIAALIVVCYHTGTLFSVNVNYVVFNNIFKFGHTGVSFFFVLSGFIIYYIHHKDLNHPVKLKSFLYKRLTRIYPLYWIILIAKFPTKHIDLAGGILAFFLIPVPKAYLSVSWTLSFELFFYLCFGFAIVRITKYTMPIIIGYVSLIILLLFCKESGVEQFLSLPFSINFLFNKHILEFLLGVLAAYIVVKNYLSEKRNVLFYSGTVLYIICSIATVILVNIKSSALLAEPHSQAELISCFIEDYSPFFFGIPALLIIAGAAFKDLNNEYSPSKLLLLLGDASYSIYLVHGIFINIITLKIKNLNAEVFIYTVIPVIITATFIGVLVHMFVEKPLLNFFKNKRVSSFFY